MERAPPPAATGSDTEWEEEEEELMRALGLELLLEPSEPPVSSSHSPAPLGKTEEQSGGFQLRAWSQNGCPAVEGFGQLERRWHLWHEFMKEHSNLIDWLRLAERTAASPNSAQILHVAAKQELRKFENLLRETRARHVQLDTLARWNRTLVGLFQGAMRTQTGAMVRECRQRWDRLHANIEAVCHRLKHRVSLREQFECGREEVMVWLAEMDLRLAEVESLTGRSSCDKMKELQTFQVVVIENASRVNELLDSGEALMQRSQPEDTEDIEAELEEVVLFCDRVFEGAGRLHTRLLSMRLVLEDDWVLIPAPDSGCPSEALQEEESSPPMVPHDHPGPHHSSPPLDPPDLHHLSPPHDPPGLHRLSPHLSSPHQDPPGPHHLSPPLNPPDPHHSSPPSLSTLDHQVLEWDPSVDIGHSITPDDTDSSYFSADPGLRSRDETLARDFLKRRSYTSCLGSLSDITRPPDDLILNTGHGQVHRRMSGGVGGACFSGRWATSTPSGASSEPVTFDPDRISAWLGKTAVDDRFFSGPAPHDPGSQSCSRSVQTDLQCPGCHCMRDPSGHSQPCCHDNLEACLAPQSCDIDLQSDWLVFRRREPQPQSSELTPRALPGDQTLHPTCPPGGLKVTSGCSALRWVLLSMLLALGAWVLARILDTDCRRGNAMGGSSHLALRYVNGPPPT